MDLSQGITILTVALASGLAVLGVLFIVKQETAFALSGHVRDALPTVMGGRYLGLAILIVGLLAMADWKALALAFGIGAGFGFFDGVVVKRAGGSIVPHFGAGTVSAVLAMMCILRAAE